MRFIPKEAQFADQFAKLTDKIQEGGKMLADLWDIYPDVDRMAARLKEIEHEADDLANNIYKDLHATFITPLDREDIFAMVTNLDNIMDMIESTATKLTLYKLKSPVPEMQELSLLLYRMIVMINHTIHRMKNRGENVQQILMACIEINSLENEADQVMRQALSRLFDEKKDVVELIKCKDILENIENTTDICEDVSNIIEGIILKYG